MKIMLIEAKRLKMQKWTRCPETKKQHRIYYKIPIMSKQVHQISFPKPIKQTRQNLPKTPS